MDMKAVHSVSRKGHKFSMNHMQMEMEKPGPWYFLEKLDFGQLPPGCFIFEVYLLNHPELSGSKNSCCFGIELIVA